MDAKRTCTEVRKGDPDALPGVTWHGLHCRMHETVRNGHENEANTILLLSERRELALSMNAAGKAGHGFDKDARDAAVYDILRYRQAMNKKGGRAFRKLSPNAMLVLKAGKPGKDFWRKFFVQFKEHVYLTKQVLSTFHYASDMVFRHRGLGQKGLGQKGLPT